MNKKHSKIWARIALLLVGMIWGSSLVVVKSATDTISPNFLLAMRFSMACILLAVIFHKKLKLINLDYLKSGAIIGTCLFIAYCSQTIGVTFAMPGKSAFLSSIYCVIVPFIFWMINKTRPDRFNVISAVLCVFGIILSSVTSGFTIEKGDTLALISGFFFASHIAAVGKYGKDKDPILITILQFAFSAVLSWIVAFTMESGSTKWNVGSVMGVVYLAVFCTGIALLLQNVGQKYTDPSSASILMSTESIFGVVFSVIFMNEELNWRLVLGFALIFASVIISETKLSFITQKISFLSKFQAVNNYKS
jgi:drug/metabolite transporter (DMT)-like permease